MIISIQLWIKPFVFKKQFIGNTLSPAHITLSKVKHIFHVIEFLDKSIKIINKTSVYLIKY